MRLDADGNIGLRYHRRAEDDQFDVLRATPDGGCIIGGSSHFLMPSVIRLAM